MMIYHLGKMCGEVFDDTFVKKVRRFDHEGRKSHYFDKFEGYGISVKVIDDLLEKDVKRVVIIEQDGLRRVLHSRLIADWVVKAWKYIDISTGVKDEQLILPVSKMVAETHGEQ